MIRWEWQQHLFFAVSLSFIALNSAAADAEVPVSFDPRFTLQLVAQEPDIVTPTGAAVDAAGRIWVIENNTHFAPKTYKGFASDRIRILEDFGPDGRAKKFTTFAEGFKNSMNLIFGEGDAVIFATRSEILELRDPKKTGQATERKTLISLETKGNYPHNGLAGLALSPQGLLYFGLGENLGEAYTLSGSDGIKLTGGGEGGNIYCCKPDGSELRRVATGFWNPWGLGFDSTGRLFAVDNDPDSRPPCRLLHVVEGGDYGYRFRYGRKGIHPFVAWNGEIPGTLPMVSGTGEAPCAVISCNSPSDFSGDLLVTAWADHVIQRFRLEPLGSSFRSIPEVLIKGSLDFRPVALVRVDDDSMIVTDWVSSSYPVHGKGRVWRIRVKDGLSNPPEAKEALLKKVNPAFQLQMLSMLGGIGRKIEKTTESARLAFTLGKLNEMKIEPEVRREALASLKDKQNAPALIQFLGSPDPFMFATAINTLAAMGDAEVLLKAADAVDARTRVGALLALRKMGGEAGKSSEKTLLPKMLLDPDIAVRRAALQWVGEERLTELGPKVDEVAALPMTRDLFEAFLATKSLLSGDKPDKGEYIESQMAQIFPSDKNPVHLRVLALKNLRVDHPGVTVARLRALLSEKDDALRIEAIRALALHAHPDAQIELRKLAVDAAVGLELRAACVAGLARSAAKSPETREVLLALLSAETPPALQREALRSLRSAGAQVLQPALREFAGRLPAAPVEWRAELAEQALFAQKGDDSPAPEIKRQLDALAGKRPANEAEWTTFAAQPNPIDSAAAGERAFYHIAAAQCFKCHRINGRGGNIGPDLSTIGKTVVRERNLQSILDPSRDVAPEFVPWTLVLRDGRRLTGVIVEENDGVVQLGDATGTVTKIKVNDIERRGTQKGSIMPDNLIQLLTKQELRDLLAFLAKEH